MPTTYNFDLVLVHDVLPGGALRTLRNTKITARNVNNNAIMATPTSDAQGRVTFTTTNVPTVSLESPGGFYNVVTSPDAIAAALSAGAATDTIVTSLLTTDSATRDAGDARWARTDQQPLNASRFADLQSALSALSSPLYSVRELLVPPGTYTVSSGLTLAADDATVTFQPGAVVSLASSDFNARALTISGSRNRVVGGAVTSSARKKFLVSITGSDNVVERVRASHTTKSTMAPVPGTSIYYNQGGFEVKGSRNVVRKAEAANTEGAGFYLYGDGNTITNCYSHDNCTGVIVETGSTNAAILDSVIVNNNVNNAEAYDGILATCDGLVVRGNTIVGNGEHGTYLHGQNVVVSGNVVRGNYFNGIKLGNVEGFTVTGNVLDGNVTSLLTSESQIYIQKTFTNGTITGNVERANVAGTFIRVWSDTTGSYGVTITGNTGIGNIMVHAHRDLVVSGNITAGDILLGFNDASYPSLAGAVVSDNSANRIHLTRCTAPIVDSNVVKKITATADPLAATIKNNRMSAQDTGIPLRAVADFSGNTVVFTMTNATDTLFQQHTSKLTGGRFVNNVFTSSGGRFVYFTSEAISSDGMTFSGNTFAGVLQPLYFWGSGHMVIGNRADQQMGFLGCSNSIITNNIKEPSIRAGYTGNVIANNIT